MQLFKLLSDAARDPTDPLLISPEKRLIATDGQFGYDLGWSGGRHLRNEVWEAKLAPSPQDVQEFLASSRERFEENGELDPAPRLVAAERTAPFKALDRLVRLAREAEDASAFAGLAQAAASTTGLHRYLELLEGSAWNVLRSILEPQFVPETQADTVIATIANMTAMPGSVSLLGKSMRRCMDKASWGGGLKQSWTGLPVWGQVLAVVAPLVVLIGIIVTFSGLTGHSESWEYGYDHAGPAISLIRQGVSAESGCRSVVGIAAGYATKEQTETENYGEMYDGCMAAVKDRR